MSEEYNNTPASTEDRIDYDAQPYGDAELPYVEVPSASSYEQPTSSVQQPAQSTEEARLAAAYQLGNVLKYYKGEPTAFTTDNLPSASLVMPTILICIGMFLLWGLTWPIILVCMLILTPWFSTVIGRLPADVMTGLQNAELYLCANGLMIIKWTRVQAIRWEQIQAVRRNMMRGLQHYSYTLYLYEGKPVTLDRYLVGPEIRRLGEVIESKVSQRLLPDAIAAYEAGLAVNFGAINVTAQGLTLEDEEQSLEWERFAAVDYYHGYYVTIRAMQERETTSIWQKIEVASMLNLCVFLSLIAHIKSSLRASAQQSEDVATHSHEMGEEGARRRRETKQRFQEQHSAREEELERMRRVHEEILERLRSRREVAQIPEEVVEALRVLELPSDASFDMIRHQYRQLAKRSHPDMGGDPGTFKRINAAYKCVVAWITSHGEAGGEFAGRGE